MSRKKTLFWIGMVLYAVSFALVAVADRWPAHGFDAGWVAAISAIWAPLAFNPFQAGGWVFQDGKFVYVSLLISGLINPLFLVTLTLAVKGYQQTVVILRIILLLMIPFCW